MAIGKGGQKGSQSQSGTSSGTTSNTSMPIIGDDWLRQYQGAGGTLGANGVTADQQGNVNALQGINNSLDYYTRAGYYGLGDMSERLGGQWATPNAVNAPTVNAQTGASFMDAYKNPWDSQVIDASVNDYNTNVDRTSNAMRAGRDASGAFGDRAAIADAVYQGDASRGLGALTSGLRQQGFNTAAGYGQADANRDFGAQSTNAANSLAAQTFNNNMTNNRQQFDVNTGFRGDEMRMGAYDRMSNNVLAQSGIQSGGINNLMNYLGLGTQTFGQQNDGTYSGQTQSNGGSSSKGGGVSLG